MTQIELISTPSLAELDKMVAQYTALRAKWSGNAGYARHLDIELFALAFLREHLAKIVYD